MCVKEILIFFYPSFHRLQIYVKNRCLENILSFLKKSEKIHRVLPDLRVSIYDEQETL